MYDGEIISYSITERPVFAEVVDMLEKAFSEHPNLKGLILHSDQGWQYQMKQYHYKLKEKDIIQSMSRRGNCLDNSVIENFFDYLKSGLPYLQEFESVEHFRAELEKYIRWYNTRRIKNKLKGLSPVEYRIQSLSAA